MTDKITPKQQEILDKITPIFVEKFGLDKSDIKMDETLDGLDLVAMDCIELFMDLQIELDLSIPDEEPGTIRTIGDIVRLIERTSTKFNKTVAPKVAEPEQKPAVLNSRKFVTVQNFTYDPNTPDYSGRPTQINVGVMSEEVRKNFIECIRNCKPIDGNEFHCGFDVYCDDKTGFEVRPNRKQPAVDWNVSDCLNRAGKNEMVIEMRPGRLEETDCPVSRSHDCPLCIASGKCPSPFIRKYIGKVFFPNQYGKQR